MLLQCLVTVQVLYKTPNKFNLLKKEEQLIEKDTKTEEETTKA
jgi:hypothetical protein